MPSQKDKNPAPDSQKKKDAEKAVSSASKTQHDAAKKVIKNMKS